MSHPRNKVFIKFKYYYVRVTYDISMLMNTMLVTKEGKYPQVNIWLKGISTCRSFKKQCMCFTSKIFMNPKGKLDYDTYGNLFYAWFLFMEQVLYPWFQIIS